MKKIITVILSVILIFSFAACSNNNDNTQPVNVDKKSGDTSVTYNFFKDNFDSQEYTMVLKTNDDETGIESVVTIGIKGNIYYTDDKTSAGHQTIFFKDGQTTTISHDDKAYYVTVTQDEMSSQNEGFSSQDFRGKEYTSGYEKYNDVKYYYEEFNDEYGVTRYLFDGDNLKYMVNVDTDKSTYIEIADLKHSFDENLLSIPDGYELLNY